MIIDQQKKHHWHWLFPKIGTHVEPTEAVRKLAFCHCRAERLATAETVEIVMAVAGGLFALGVILTVGHRPLLVINLVILSLIYLLNFNGKCDSLNDIKTTPHGLSRSGRT